MEEWIGNLNSVLSIVKWNASLTPLIQDYLNHTDYTQTTVDTLLMAVTKAVEASLRDAVARFTSSSVPTADAYGINLLNYAKNKGFIQEAKRGTDCLFSLMYWFFEKPRNKCHHFFTDFPLPTYIAIISDANFILNEIERLSSAGNYYTAKTFVNYDQAKKILNISVADIKKDDKVVVPPVLEMNLVAPDKAMKAYPLQNTGNSWDLQVNTGGLMKGTFSVYLWGHTGYEKFNISGSAIVVV